VRLALSSDWHADRVTDGIPRYSEIEAAAWASAKAAVEWRADAYVFLGDLADPDGGPSTLRAVALAVAVAQHLAMAGVWSHWLPGNHDVFEDGSGGCVLDAIRGFETLRGPKPELLAPGPFSVGGPGGAPALALPFAPSSHGYDVAGSVGMAMDGALVFSHLVVPGITPGSETTEMPRGREVRLPIDLVASKRMSVFQGHYHRRQVHAGVQVVGSLARLTHGEASHDPGFLLAVLP
jgi:hypothetical protein